ncbi:MAG: APC family permease [Nitrososphaeria archaeon]
MNRTRSSLKSGSAGFLDTVYNSLAGQAPAYSIASGAAFIMGSSYAASPLAMLITMMAVMPVVYAVYTLSRRYLHAASFYKYTAEGIGRPAGFLNGVFYTVFYSLIGLGSVAVAFAYLGAEGIYAISGIQINPILLFLLPIIVALPIAYFGIRPSVKVELSLTSFEIAVLALFSILSIIYNVDHMSVLPFTLQGTFSSSPSGILAALSGGLVFGITYFMGFEVSTQLSEEAKNPRATVPRATTISTLMMGTLYVLVMYAMVLDMGMSQSGISSFVTQAQGLGPNPVYTLVGQYLGRVGMILFAASIMLSVFGSYLATLNATARMFYGMARDGMSPSFFSHVNARHGSPHVALIFSSAVAVFAAGITYIIAFASGYSGIQMTYNAMEYSYAIDSFYYVFSLILIALSAFRIAPKMGKAVVIAGAALLSITFYYSIVYLPYLYIFLGSTFLTILAYLAFYRNKKLNN